MRTRSLIAFALLVSTSAAHSEPRRPAGFGFICAQPDARISSDFRQVIAPLMAEFGAKGVAAWGDRAVPVSLSTNSTQLLVPLSCGATGGCSWAILASSPARSLGVIGGSIITVRAVPGGWAIIDVFMSDGPGEGCVTSYEFHDGHYRKVVVGKLKPAEADWYQSCVDNESCCPKSAT